MTVFIVLFIVGLGVVAVYRIKNDPKLTEIPPKWAVILEKEVRFYRELDPAGKKRFLDDVLNFLNSVTISGVSTEVTITDRMLVASSAVIPLFGFPSWEYKFLDEVILYPSAFDQDFNFENPKMFINGMVGDGMMEGKMILSKKALHLGFDNTRDKRNVGIHEFIHLYDKEDGSVDGVPPIFQREAHALPWLELIKKKMDDVRSEDSDIRDYGGTNLVEFFAAAGEYFFERPHLMKKKHPELYRMMETVFNQSPTEVLAIKESKKKQLGRNDDCPCGSGEKYKHCCLKS